MKKLLLATAAIVAISSGANAQERFPNWYLGLSAGLTHQNDSDVSGAAVGEVGYDTGSVFSAALGYQPPSFGGFRTEAEFSTRKQDFDTNSGDIKAETFALNGYYDFLNNSTVTPYVGAGIGYTKFDVNSNVAGLDGSDRKMTYQLMAGLGYETQALPNVQWTAGYRYFAPFSDPEAAGTEIEYDNHGLELGAKFRF